MLANAVDVVEPGEHCGEHIDDALLTGTIHVLLRAVAVVDELRALTLKRLEVFGGFLLGLAKRCERGTLSVAIGGGVCGGFGSCLGGLFGGLFACGLLRGGILEHVVFQLLAGVRWRIGAIGIRGRLPVRQFVGVGQVVQVIVLIEVGHYLLSLSSSSTTSASTTSSSPPLFAEPLSAAPAAPSAPCWA